MVELVSPLFARRDQPGLLQYRQMLGYGLPGQTQLVSTRQADTDLEQGLTVALGQLVENGPPGGIGKGFEDITHAGIIGKSILACQCGALLDPVDELWRRMPYLVHCRPG